MRQAVKRKRRRRSRLPAFLILVLLTAAAVFIITKLLPSGNDTKNTDSPAVPDTYDDSTDSSASDAEKTVAAYAADNGYSLSDYPESLISLLERNPEAETFVLQYPAEHGKTHTIDLSEYKNTSSVPLFIQWDTRWGYESYGGNIIGLAGCGPTCLSMVSVYLLGDTSLDPLYMCNYSYDSGYYVEGSGTSWELMTTGAQNLGLDVTEIPLDEQRMVDNLQVGNPIICCMGPGAFTTEGHYIVLTGYEDGKFSVNDPNSYKNSEKLWSYDEIQDQIRNIWVYRRISY